MKIKILMGIKNIFYFIIIIFLIGCDFELSRKSITPERSIVVVYMVADNNLDYYSLLDINEMEKGMPVGSGNVLLVYVDRGQASLPSHPYVLRIVHDESDEIKSPVLLTFPEQNSTDVNVFKDVLEQCISYYKDQNFTSTGLIMWSHGNAWLPKGVKIPSNRDKFLEDTTKSFGLDVYPVESNMDIKELGNVLKQFKIQFIIFDACFMSSIEVVYELKDVTKYLIASPTEILSNGFPYTEIIPLVLNDVLNYKKIGETYFNFYKEKTGILNSASIAVIKMDEIDNLTKTISNYTSVLSNYKLNITIKDSIQEFDRLDGRWVFDLSDFVEKTTNKYNIDKKYLSDFKEQLNKTVIYKNNTSFISKTLELKNCNGISTYIPQVFQDKEINEYYKTFSWYKASGYDKIFTGF